MIDDKYFLKLPTVKTEVLADGRIKQTETREFNRAVESYMNPKEEHVKLSLQKLGWMTPEDAEEVYNMVEHIYRLHPSSPVVRALWDLLNPSSYEGNE